MLRCTTSFQEFCSNQASDDELELKEDYSCKTVRVNIYGKKIQGTDLEWRLKYKFLSPSEYFESQLYIEIKEMFRGILCFVAPFLFICYVTLLFGKLNFR